MEDIDFEQLLLKALDDDQTNVVHSIMALLEQIPPEAVCLNIEVFPAQDGDGFFTVLANCDGPDLYVLNKQLEGIRDIFTPKYTEIGLSPYIPTVDPFEIDFSVNNLVVDTFANWLLKLWKQNISVDLKIPVFVVGHEDQGNITPIKLH